MSDTLHLTAFCWLCAGTLATLATGSLVVVSIVAVVFVVLRVGAYALDRRERSARW